MNPIDIAIIVVAVAIVGGFVSLAIWRKKTGRHRGCGCGCDCSGCVNCPSKSDKN